MYLPRIGILTLPLLTNFGGLIQAAALQHAIRKLGGSPININYALPSVINTWHIKGKIRRFFLPLALKLGIFKILRQSYNSRWIPAWAAKKLGLRSMTSAKLGIFQQSFIRKHINESHFCSYPISSRDLKKLHINACVVGSDQVWRYSYVPDKRLFFCNFVPPDIRKKTISYAASFGVDTWEWPEDLTQACRPLAREFKAHSVREESGIALCREHLGVEAQWMPDPTFLLSRNEYRDIIMQGKEPPLQKPGEYIAYYILDMTDEKRKRLKEMSAKTGLPLLNCMHDAPLEQHDETRESAIFRPIEHWLELIASARYVITDSFHGSVFSIIFNTEFICFGNAHRGNSRFDSLFAKLDLTEHFIMPEASLIAAAFTVSSWTEINNKLTSWKKQGLTYLKNNLNL